MSESGSVRSSLRQRPRVRYDTLGSFEGVDLGDDEAELRRLRPMSSSDEDDRGAEDENGLDGSAMKRKSKGKGKETASKKGRGGSSAGKSRMGRSREASESEFELDEDADDGAHEDDLDPDAVDEDSGGEGFDDYDDDDIVDFGDRKSAKKNAKKGGPSGSGKGMARAKENDSDADALFASQYSVKNKLGKNAKKDSSALNVNQFGGAIAKAFKQGNWRVLVENTLPLHPTGQTFLRAPPDLSKFSDVWVVDTEENPKGRGLSDEEGVGMLHGHWTKVPLEMPYTWWTGQGWWPDCYYAYEDEGNGDARMTGHGKGRRKRRKIDWKTEKGEDYWKQKVDVTLDLDQVGRYELASLHHLTIAYAFHSCYRVPVPSA